MDRQRLHQSALTSRLPQVEAKAAGGLAHESTLGAKAHQRVTMRHGRPARPVQCRSLAAIGQRQPGAELLVGFLIASAKTDSPAALIESLLLRDHSLGRWRSFAWLAGVSVFLSFRRQARSHFVAGDRIFVRFLSSWPVRTPSANNRNGAWHRYRWKRTAAVGRTSPFRVEGGKVSSRRTAVVAGVPAKVPRERGEQEL